MNKRQAKKAFKKKYGINPSKAAKLLNKLDINKVMQQAAEVINKFAEQLPEKLRYLQGKEVKDIAGDIKRRSQQFGRQKPQ